MKCSCCGLDLGDFCIDKSFGLPDEVFAIPPVERASKVKHSDDLCQFNGKYFIRTILYIPISNSNEAYGWGFWCEVLESDFDTYLNWYNEDGSNEAPITGQIANNIPSYPFLMGCKVSIQFGRPDQRPVSKILKIDHPLYTEQQNGISIERVHELNEI